MKNLPKDVTAYKRTPEFNERTVPKGLLNAHRTRAGTWAEIVVLAGELRYVILEPARESHILSVDEPGVVEPTVLHQVAPMGSVRFYVQFYA